jgi:hypothetical protein
MTLIKGPFILRWGDSELQDVEEIEFEHTVNSEDIESIQGKVIEIDGTYKATVNITLLETDIQALSLVLPQHHVVNGGEMSTGETVNNDWGAIDIVPRICDDAILYRNLDIISCENPANVMRLVHARTKLEGIEIDSMLRKVIVKFIGESESTEATVQFFKEGTIAVVS